VAVIKNKGFGFVHMGDQQAAEAIQMLNGSTVLGGVKKMGVYYYYYLFIYLFIFW
jgi:hypothetical protein